MRQIYLALAVLGAFAPVIPAIAFIDDHGLDFGEMWDQVTASSMATLVLLDLTVSIVAFWTWLSREAPRIGVRVWPFVVATLGIGLCFALPLFLYVRSGKLEESAAAA